jgi:hypothetical protein
MLYCEKEKADYAIVPAPLGIDVNITAKPWPHVTHCTTMPQLTCYQSWALPSALANHRSPIYHSILSGRVKPEDRNMTFSAICQAESLGFSFVF